MNKKFLIIEKRPSQTAPFWHQLPEIETEPDQHIRSAWYNIDLDHWNPNITGTEDHANSEGLTCDDAGYCVCGPYQNMIIGANTHVFETKVKPEAYPITPLPESSEYYKHYQARLDHNQKHNIQVTFDWVDADEHWHTIE